MKNLVKTLLVALVVIFMTAISVLSASAAPTVPAKSLKAQVKSTVSEPVSVVTFHSVTSVEAAASQDVKIDSNNNKVNDFAVTVPWSQPNPTGWTNPNARANSFC